MTIVTECQAELLKQYVTAVGTLVIGCRSGYKNSTGQCVTDTLPGLLSELTGTDIPEYLLYRAGCRNGDGRLGWHDDRGKCICRSVGAAW